MDTDACWVLTRPTHTAPRHPAYQHETPGDLSKTTNVEENTFEMLIHTLSEPSTTLIITLQAIANYSGHMKTTIKFL